METNSKEKKAETWQRGAFFLSLILNALLFVLLLLLILQKPFALHFYYKTKERIPEIFVTNYEELKKIDDLSVESLIATLEDKTLIEQGYRRRDLALAIMSSRHFDLKRALGRLPFSRRLQLQEGSLLVYPGLNDEDFRRIINFLQDEKWPFTLEGLIEAMRRKGFEDDSLNIALEQTPEFLLMERFFDNQKVTVDKKMLFCLLIEAGHGPLATTLEQQRSALDLSGSARRAFLFDYIEKKGSKVAAALLLRTDFHWVLRQLDDERVISLLEKLPPRSRLSLIFAKKLIKSPRSEKVHIRARKLLIQARPSNLQLITSNEVAALLPKITTSASINNKSSNPLVQRQNPRPSVGKLKPAFREKPLAAPPTDLHIIQKGETIYSISLKYGIKVSSLMQYNQLKSTNLAPGKALRIPPRL